MLPVRRAVLDFGKVLDEVAGFLEAGGFRYAVIGGVALAAYGLPRTTLDLDLVVDAGAQDALVSFLESRGYETLHRSTGYSNHLHPDPSWGGLDFVYVRRETSREIFAGCRLAAGPRGREIPLPRPEHLAAMKAVAMKNDPGRTFQELADVRFLLTIEGVDRAEIRRQFERHGLGERFDDLEKIT
jgi:hypothetical protein